MCSHNALISPPPYNVSTQSTNLTPYNTPTLGTNHTIPLQTALTELLSHHPPITCPHRVLIPSSPYKQPSQSTYLIIHQ